MRNKMTAMDSLFALDFDHYAPDRVMAASFNQQLTAPIFLLVLESWSATDRQLLTRFINSFEHTFGAKFPASLLIYQNWTNEYQNEQVSTDFVSFLEQAANGLSDCHLMTLPAVAESHLPSVLKEMAACVFLIPNPLLMAQALAMNVPLMVPFELDLDWQAPFVYRFHTEQHHMAKTLSQIAHQPTFTPTPRQFIQNKIQQQFDQTWQQVTELQPQHPAKAWEQLKRIFPLILRRKEHPITDLKLIIKILEANQENQWADQFVDYVLCTPLPLVPRHRSDRIYEDTFRTCCEYIKGNTMQGDILEFGTYLGYTSRIMVQLIQEYGLDSDFYTYDSFTGFADISAEDQQSYEVAVNRVWAKGTLAFSQRVADRLSKKLATLLPERAHVISGYFEDTLPRQLPQHPVVLVHIDCDLYSPSRLVLDMLLAHQLLQDGTILLFDDYNCNRGNPTMGERRAVQEAFDHQERFTYSPWFAYGWGGQAMIVHDLAVRRFSQSLIPGS